MAKATTYAVTHNGVTFTTKSVRPVSHAVVSRAGAARISEAKRSVAEWEGRLASGEWPSWTVEEKTVALERSRVWLARLIADAEAERPNWATWHTRHDLAVKEATRRGQDGWSTDVRVIAVEAR